MTHQTSSAVTLFCFLLAALCTCAEAQRRLCGGALADALEQACSAGYRPGKRASRISETIYNKEFRAAQTPKGVSSLAAEQQQRSDNVPSSSHHHQWWSPNELNAMETLAELQDMRMSDLTKADDQEVDPRQGRTKRQTRQVNIVDECCRQPCSLQTLLSYCPDTTAPITDASLVQLGHLLGFTTPGVSTQRTTTATTTTEPSPTFRPAQIVRGRGRGRNATFFYVTFGDQATRSPLITE